MSGSGLLQAGERTAAPTLTPLDKMQFHISCSSHFIAYRIDRHSLLLAVCMAGG